MEIKFITDKMRDEFEVWRMLRDPMDDNFARGKRMGLEIEDIKSIREAEDYEEVSELIEGLSDQRYEVFKGQVEKAVKEYQADWDNISFDVVKKIREVTGFNWQYEKYFPIVSLWHPGTAANVGEDFFFLSAWETSRKNSQFLTHEMIMNLLFFNIPNLYPEASDPNNEKFWRVNEIAAAAVLTLVEEINVYWGGYEYSYDNMLNSYPELKELQKSLKTVFLKRKNFEDFYRKAVKVSNKLKI